MTGYTICSKRYEVLGGKWLVNLQVTIAACVLIKRGDKPAFMAIFTHIVLVRLQREPGRVVVKCDLLPIGGSVASGTLRTIGTIMRVIRSMTGGTILWRAFEDAVDMATLTSHGRMLTVKMEGKLGMIYIGRFPTFR